MNSLEYAISSLNYKLERWIEESKSDKSDMNKKDVKFLKTRIERLEKLKLKVSAEIEKVYSEIDSHTSKW